MLGARRYSGLSKKNASNRQKKQRAGRKNWIQMTNKTRKKSNHQVRRNRYGK